MTHCSTRLKGDYKVNLALDNRLERESNYTRKKSITVEAEAIYNRALNYNMVQGEIPGTTPENESRPNPVLSDTSQSTLFPAKTVSAKGRSNELEVIAHFHSVIGIKTTLKCRFTKPSIYLQLSNVLVLMIYFPINLTGPLIVS